MSAVSEAIVRDYLEGLGFAVLQPRKYQVVARAKRPDEEIDLLAWNPNATGGAPEPGVWTGADLRCVRAMVVGIRGWHTERFSPSTLESSPDVLRIGAPDVLKEAARRLGVETVTPVLCLPGLPASLDLQRRALSMIRESGIAGVLPFRTILLELSGMVRSHFVYDQSDVMQLMRILKSYGLLRSAQMDLFRTRRKSAKVRDEEVEDDASADAAEGEEETASAEHRTLLRQGFAGQAPDAGLNNQQPATTTQPPTSNDGTSEP
jgi:hypothetical protein